MGFMGIAKMNQKDLVYMKELLEAGKVVPVIERRYALRETAEALQYLEEGHARGKVVITVEQNLTVNPNALLNQLEKGRGTRIMDNFPPYDPREPQQQQQQAQWQAPQSHQWHPEWQAPPRPVPPQYIPYPGKVPVMVMEPQKSWLATVLQCQFLGTLGCHTGCEGDGFRGEAARKSSPGKQGQQANTRKTAISSKS
jgi:hypothetical protein